MTDFSTTWPQPRTYALLVSHACGHQTAKVWPWQPTEQEIDDALSEPCGYCTATYRVTVRCACGHEEVLFGDNWKFITPALEALCKSRLCFQCAGAVIIEVNHGIGERSKLKKNSNKI